MVRSLLLILVAGATMYSVQEDAGASVDLIGLETIVGAAPQDCTDEYVLPEGTTGCGQCQPTGDPLEYERCDHHYDESCISWNGLGCIACDAVNVSCPEGLLMVFAHWPDCDTNTISDCCLDRIDTNGPCTC